MIQKWCKTIGGVVIGLLVGALAFAGFVQAAPDGSPLLAPVGTKDTSPIMEAPRTETIISGSNYTTAQVLGARSGAR